MTDSTARIQCAVIGGTGKLGFGLGLRLAAAGHQVVLGSRDSGKAAASAEKMAWLSGHPVSGSSIEEAAQQAQCVIVAVPFSAQAETYATLAPYVEGKVVVDTTVPLVPPKVARVQLPLAGSAAMAARSALPESALLVSAFQNVAAAHLRDLHHEIGCDVLVCGDDREARQTVIDLAESIGIKAWHAGALDNAVAAEALTSILIFMNRHYSIDGAGIRITGDPAPAGRE
jgi:8-hydroxy-5-deazaflavin:NADPH oxidoreductase